MSGVCSETVKPCFNALICRTIGCVMGGLLFDPCFRCGGLNYDDDGVCLDCLTDLAVADITRHQGGTTS